MKKQLFFGSMLVGVLGLGVTFYIVLSKSNQFRTTVVEQLRTEFISYATTAHGTQRLQVAELNQMEVFERTSQLNLFWDQLRLPPIVVSISTPVKFTYSLELQDGWSFEVNGKQLIAMTPPLIPGTPAPDLSKTKFEVKTGSMFRDEYAALRELQKEITPLLERRAVENIALIREQARKSTESFVQTWAAQKFPSTQEGYSVKVVFPDEVPVKP